ERPPPRDAVLDQGAPALGGDPRRGPGLPPGAGRVALRARDGPRTLAELDGVRRPRAAAAERRAGAPGRGREGRRVPARDRGRGPEPRAVRARAPRRERLDRDRVRARPRSVAGAERPLDRRALAGRREAGRL